MPVFITLQVCTRLEFSPNQSKHSSISKKNKQLDFTFVFFKKRLKCLIISSIKESRKICHAPYKFQNGRCSVGTQQQQQRGLLGFQEGACCIAAQLPVSNFHQLQLFQQLQIYLNALLASCFRLHSTTCSQPNEQPPGHGKISSLPAKCDNCYFPLQYLKQEKCSPACQPYWCLIIVRFLPWTQLLKFF